MSISLGSSLKSTLQNVNRSQRAFDKVQTRLGDGKKNDSAIEDPSSFFTASSLNTRSKELNNLIDNMGQAVELVKTASLAIESAINLVDHVSAITQKAVDLVEQSPEETLSKANVNFYAVARNETELTDAINNAKEGQYIVIDGEIDINEGTSLNLKKGQKLVGVGHFSDLSPSLSDDTGEQRARLNFTGDAHGIITADDNLVSNIDINLNADTVTTQRSAIYANGSSNLKIQDMSMLTDITNGAGGSGVSVVMATNSQIEFSGDINMMSRGVDSDALETFDASSSMTFKSGNYIIDANGEGSCGIVVNGSVSFEDGANTNISTDGNNSDGIDMNGNSADINWKKGSNTTVQVISGSSAEALAVHQAGANLKADSGSTIILSSIPADAVWGTGGTSIDLEAGAKVGLKSGGSDGYWEVANTNTQTISGSLNSLSGANYSQLSTSSPVFNVASLSSNNYDELGYDTPTQLGAVKNEYNTMIDQYDGLVEDAYYRGNNLLMGDDLEVKFNVTGSTGSVIKGHNILSRNIGLSEITKSDWNYKSEVEANQDLLRDVKTLLRGVEQDLETDLNVIKLREDFSKDMINVLTGGADKLQLADMNEEGAKALSIQTAISMGQKCFGFAAEHDRSILNAFN